MRRHKESQGAPFKTCKALLYYLLCVVKIKQKMTSIMKSTIWYKICMHHFTFPLVFIHYYFSWI